MTKRLEEVLDLKPMEENNTDMEVVILDDEEIDDLSGGHELQVHKFEKQIEASKEKDETEKFMTTIDLEEHDRDMDEVADVAKEAFFSTIELAQSMEPKNAGQVLEPNVQYLKIWMDAKTRKIDARQNQAKLRINYDKNRLMAGQRGYSMEGESIIEGQGKVIGSFSDLLDVKKSM